MRTLEDWREWKVRCALELCGAPARHELQGFVAAKFAHFIRAYTASRQGPLSIGGGVSMAEAWHRFETHFRLHNSPGGKSFKEWLFSRKNTKGYSAQESVEAGATVLVRDVVRELLRREYRAARTISYSEEIAGPVAEESPGVEELLPGGNDTGRIVEERDLDELARRASEHAFAELDHRQRVALLAHQAGLSLVDASVIGEARCGRGTMYAAFRGALACIAACARLRYASEERGVQAVLACRMYSHVSRLVFAWGKAETGLVAVCSRIEAMG
jgi:hypothetical protein